MAPILRLMPSLCLVHYEGMQEDGVSLRHMKSQDKSTEPKRFAGTNLVREVSYLHEDEALALAERARKELASKAEIIRRALRAYPEIED